MQQQSTIRMPEGGRAASRARRMQTVQGKAGLPAAKERTRNGAHNAPSVNAAPMPAPAPQPTPAKPSAAPVVTSVTDDASTFPTGGRAASIARRKAQVQGKQGLQKIQKASSSVPVRADVVATPAPASTPVVAGGVSASSGRQVAQAMRAARALKGRGNSEPARPNVRVRNPDALVYPPKVSESTTYAAQRVTGVRVGRGGNVTGDEPGANCPVSGTQYIGTETGYSPREGGVKVGASRTEGGLVVTGSQVRSKVMVTGDESRSDGLITGEADQTLNDDVIARRDQGGYATSQFQRQNNPHGSSVFGRNLGRSIKSVGSRLRSDEAQAGETSVGGHMISGSAVGRSEIVTGDETGSCRSITGSQYLRPAGSQPLCDQQTGQGSRPMMGRVNAAAPRGETETWARQRISGVEVEFKPGVTGDEQGTCSTVTGTPYSGPRQYETYCDTGAIDAATGRMGSCGERSSKITGNLPLNLSSVTGTARGADRDVSGTPYYREDVNAAAPDDVVEDQAKRFSIRSPQRDAHLQAQTTGVQAEDPASRITGSFAVGRGKITGNQEFNFAKRWQDRGDAQAPAITGEGKMAGATITGGAWEANSQVTGTDGQFSTNRNPSERAGKRDAFASAAAFKGKGNHKEPTQHVTGMVGWSASNAARVTLSGGAQG